MMSTAAQFCYKCGRQRTDDEVFCPRCGTAIRTDAAEASSPRNSLTPSEVIDQRQCLHCSKTNLYKQSYCAHCGKDLEKPKEGTNQNVTERGTQGIGWDPGYGTGAMIGSVIGVIVVVWSLVSILALSRPQQPPSQYAPSLTWPAQARASATSGPGTVSTPTPTKGPTIINWRDTARSENWAYEIQSKKRSSTSVVLSRYTTIPKPKGVWLCVFLKLTNIGKQTYSVNLWDFAVVDEEGNTYTADAYSLDLCEANKLDIPGANVPPGLFTNTAFLFDVTPRASGLMLKFQQGKELLDLME